MHLTCRLNTSDAELTKHLETEHLHNGNSRLAFHKEILYHLHIQNSDIPLLPHHITYADDIIVTATYRQDSKSIDASHKPPPIYPLYNPQACDTTYLFTHTHMPTQRFWICEQNLKLLVLFLDGQKYSLAYERLGLQHLTLLNLTREDGRI